MGKYSLLVSVIIPTTNDREQFNVTITDLMQAQDYPSFEVLFDHSDNTIGAKRNRLCAQAKGEIILHADSDDFYAPDWISKSVTALIESKADLVGLRDGYFYNTNTHIGKLYQYALKQGYCLGATMCYWKKTWERNKFNETVRHGEDSLFCANAGHIYNHGYIDGFTALIHGKNTTSQTAFQTMRIVDKNTIPYVKRRSQLQGNIQ